MSIRPDAFNPPDNSEEEDSFSKNDRRYLPRWRASNRVNYVIQEGLTVEEAQTRDLSCSGVCLKLARLILPGQNIKLKIYLDERKSIEVTGNVMWNHISPEGRYAGICFDHPSIELQETILNYAFEIHPDAMTRHWFSGWSK
ncbi:MAG: PilZ domain-containing protein [Candidatus Omnitrophota bacterium]